MARLYLLRMGSGNARIASTFIVPAQRVEAYYGDLRVETTEILPTFNGDNPANNYSDPEIAVVELVEPEKGFGNFKSPGFNTLVSVDAKDVYRRLVKLTND